MADNKYDVIIAGGGVMGSSVAYNLAARDSGLKVAVVEMDPAYERASSTLSMGGVRTQFSLPDNVRISLYAQDVFERFEEDMAIDGESPAIAYHRDGYLFLIDEPGRAAAEAVLKMQQDLGAAVEWWEPDQIGRVYPELDAGQWVGGTFGPKDGHLDGYAVLMAYRNKARSLGVDYLHDRVTAVKTDQGKVTGLACQSGLELTGPVVVNAAGAWCSELARTAGVELPIVPVQRQAFAVSLVQPPARPLPLTILPSGYYFRSETGNLLLMGWSLDDDVEGIGFNWDKDRFMNQLWPALAEAAPIYDTVKLMRGWAGLYAENKLDGNAILGQWPSLEGFYLANGFSGHGLQQGPGVGRYLAELILGLEPTLDLSVFAPERIIENRPLAEAGLV